MNTPEIYVSTTSLREDLGTLCVMKDVEVFLGDGGFINHT
jgi:hypothetical protein